MAKGFFQEMKVAGLAADEATYHAFISACEKGGRGNDPWALEQQRMRLQ